jgi:hypothetical protein
MARAAIWLGCLAVGAAGALANPPTRDPAQASRAPGPAVSAPPAPAAAVPESTAAAAAPTAPTPDASAAEETGAQKRLRTAGFRPEMQNDTQVWCRTEKVLGSRLAARRLCGTPKELEHTVAETRERFTEQQNKQWNPTNR